MSEQFNPASTQDQLPPLTQAEFGSWQAPRPEDRNISAGVYIGSPDHVRADQPAGQGVNEGHEPDFYNETGKQQELNAETRRFYKMEKGTQPRLKRFGRALIKLAGYSVAAGYLGKEQIKSHFYDTVRLAGNATSIVSEKLSPKLADLAYRRGGENKWRQLSGDMLRSASRGMEKTSFSAAALAGSSKEKADLSKDNTLGDNELDNASRFTRWAAEKATRMTALTQEDKDRAKRRAERSLDWRYRGELKDWHRSRLDQHNRQFVGSVYKQSAEEAKLWTGSDDYALKFARAYAPETSLRPQYAEYTLDAAALTGGVDKDGAVTLLSPSATASRLGRTYDRNKSRIERVGVYEHAYLSGLASMLYELGFLDDNAAKLKESVVTEETSDPGTNWRNRRHVMRVPYDGSNPLHSKLAGMKKGLGETPRYVEVIASNDSNYENNTISVRAAGDNLGSGELRIAA